MVLGIDSKERKKAILWESVDEMSQESLWEFVNGLENKKLQLYGTDESPKRP